MANATAKRRRRPRGEGSIYKTADGRWRAALVREQPDGTKRRYVVSGQSEQAVRVKLGDLRRQLEATGRPTPRTTVAEYLAGWLELQRSRVRPASWLSLEGHCRVHIVPALGHLRLGDLRPSDVDRLLASIQASGRSASTAAHVRVTLVHALNDAVRDALLPRNVASLSRSPHAERGPIVYLRADEARAMIERTSDCEYGPLYAVLVSTGLRVGEALALRWEDVDLERGTLTVQGAMARTLDERRYEIAEPKTPKSRRTIPLAATAREALRHQRARQAGLRLAAGPLWQDTLGLCFTDRLGRALNSSQVSAQWQRDREAAGVRRVRLADLRHSWATLALAEGIPLPVISQLLGHTSTNTTTSFYAGVTPELQRAAADALDRALGGDRP